MRRYVIAGNWKMNMTPAKTHAFIKELAPMVAGQDKCDIVLCVPAIDIPAAVEAAIAKGKEEAERRELYITHKVIARQSEDIEWFAHLSALGKDKLRNNK